MVMELPVPPVQVTPPPLKTPEAPGKNVTSACPETVPGHPGASTETRVYKLVEVGETDNKYGLEDVVMGA
jgi:hypothetical protein